MIGSAQADGMLQRRLFLTFVAVSLAISLAATIVFRRGGDTRTVFELGNFVGLTAQSLLSGRGMDTAIDLTGNGVSVVFHGSRMPFATLLVASLASVFGDRQVLTINVVKVILMLAPLWGAVWIVLSTASPGRRVATLALALLPFLMLAFLADVCNMQVEEGYAYSLLALAFALFLRRFRAPLDATVRKGYGQAIAFALCLDALFLTKSSMILVMAVLALAYVVCLKGWRSRVVVLTIVALGPLGWGAYQKHVSGKFSLGTSLDGINLHKGNNDRFLERYPPLPGDGLDRFDSELNAGQSFRNEWQYDAYHKKAGLEYMKDHAGAAFEGFVRKTAVFFATLRKVGSGESQGGTLLAETAGMLLFRLVLWLSIGVSLRGVWTGRGVGRFVGWTYLGLLIACAVPFVAGFAYTRHASVVIYPSVLLICQWLQMREPRVAPEPA